MADYSTPKLNEPDGCPKIDYEVDDTQAIDSLSGQKMNLDKKSVD